MGIAALTKSAELLSPELHVLTEEELRNLQLLLLDMANDIADVCQEHNIPVSLGGGSLLGAVRHKGFIPWDDDMDFTMLRADFERFKSVFPGNLSNKYELKLPGDKGYLYHFPKIYRKNTIAQTIQSSEEIECVSVDIFIMENVSDNYIIRTIHGVACTALLLINSLLRMKQCENNLLKFGANNADLCTAVQNRARWAWLFGFLGLEQWLKISDTIFSLCRNSQSKYIVIPSGNGHFFRELFLREKMCDVRQIYFENLQYAIPKDYDYYLRIRYGIDYMKIPEKNFREKHAFIQLKLN